ncbi:Glycoside hydrolase/deacetylase, beta/alpha-barrel [Pseudocohnilembus persalinus]|uniref:Glycoside hydrolase/deacetylase, beta/alpha-barrel n=1 Tax=Pseudocohnilembus persalinus TaxID=266149 RepID=A0A0V0QJH2_PSEPJ|nr:Glycoside hydrolase/deacetylase, beta/alpha-barrel [Pseudocohnilembus persalinus]|eukprot:KRX02398.1 Glycoside hydrolase/deacetylase, beta/alpha-barrel [Pseudocohnilembus persalinus]
MLQKIHKKSVIYYIEKPKFKQISLTIDDVPYGYEKQIIGILDKLQIKATFFLIANNLQEEQIQFFAQAVKNGHQIANHGISNSIHALKNEKKFIKEILTCEKEIKKIYKISGKQMPKQKIYRPGSGFFNKRMIKNLKKLDYKIILGNNYPHDPQFPIPFLNEWYILRRVEEGDIIILHDRKCTQKLLNSLLPKLIERGFKFKTIDEIWE